MATYNITNLTTLQAMSAHLSDDCVLLNDIDCSASSELNPIAGFPGSFNGFAPIGQTGTEFKGTFDGGGFTLSNLYINWNDRSLGLFGVTTRLGEANGGFIKDLTIKNATIIGSGGAYVRGILAGSITGLVGDYMAIDNVSVQGSIQSTGGAGNGGVAQAVSYADFADCTAKVSIAADYNTGGFIGTAGPITLLRCSSSGSITIDSAISSLYVGGFSATDAGAPTYDNCQSAIAISFTSTHATSANGLGGFVGYANGGVYTLCYASGAIVIDVGGYIRAGGFVGHRNDGNFDQCYANVDIVCPKAGGAVAGVSAIGGFGGGITNCINCYSRGDVCSGGIQNNAASSNLYLGGFGGTITNVDRCYCTGAVGVDIPGTGATIKAGGFAASGDAGNSENFFDTETSGYSTGIAIGTTTGVTGETTANMKLEATYTAQNWDFAAVWDIATFTQPAVLQSNLTVWLSKTGDYHNFEAGLKDDDSFSVTIPTTNEIRWLNGLESLIVGTSAGEWKIASNKLDTPLSPTAYSAKRQTTYGSAAIQSLAINSSLLFVDYVGRKIREITFAPSEEKYVAPDMTELAEQVTLGGITCIAHQRNPNSILWAVRADGVLLSMVYDREQSVVAWSEHPTDGLVQSVCVVPGLTYDVVWISVARDSGTYIERMMPRNFGTDLADAFFVDSGIDFTPQLLTLDSAPTGVWAVGETITGGTSLETCQITKVRSTTTYEIAYLTGTFTDGEILSNGTTTRDCGAGYPTVADTTSTTIGGLLHLAGETVTVLGDGVEYTPADDVTANGIIVIGTAVARAIAGLPYTWKVQPMRIVLGSADGTSFGSITRVSELVVSFLNTKGAQYGSNDSDLYDIDFDDARWEDEAYITGLFSGDVVVSMPGGFSVNNPIILSGSGPYPATVRAIIARIDKTGR